MTRLQKKIRTKFQAKDFELLKHHMRQYKPDSWNDEKLMFPSLYQQKIQIGSPKGPQITQNFNMHTQPDEDSNQFDKSNTQKLYRQKSQGENQFNYFPDSDFIVQQIHSNTPDARLQTHNIIITLFLQ
ncbi:hypothetical protein PPERSA_06764 [Pseudocohnilembus persalinus]|uniref:Uncharacterized protein n=1 Tax=Pseudocohnilembus persalinus TaxID=266149 RepID=A0A0V0QT39_PSEPJ|nr:hypothetical protein PPERSA_06764 [Pseudocohnilembus persalinus]|eukprot:KRX05130.1 hypothetical protein PPERSA_06764 [Pseudocohnilembus persalinus]